MAALKGRPGRGAAPGGVPDAEGKSKEDRGALRGRILGGGGKSKGDRGASGAGAAAASARGDETERRLIESAQRDPGRFAELYENNFERVYTFIARRVGDREQVQDLTADVFHSALKNLNRFEWRGVPFVAWLYRIAANAIADGGKRAARFETLKLLEGAEPEQSNQTELEDIEYRARLFKLVDQLPDDQRRVIAMRFTEQKSIAEIANQIGRSEGAVKQLQFRGLKNLRTMMGER